jgi:hypothetical protein
VVWNHALTIAATCVLVTPRCACGRSGTPSAARPSRQPQPSRSRGSTRPSDSSDAQLAPEAAAATNPDPPRVPLVAVLVTKCLSQQVVKSPDQVPPARAVGRHRQPPDQGRIATPPRPTIQTISAPRAGAKATKPFGCLATVRPEPRGSPAVRCLPLITALSDAGGKTQSFALPTRRLQRVQSSLKSSSSRITSSSFNAFAAVTATLT